ncbi:MAG TPA: hypothetical protein DEF18_01985, partial [Muricauda sp.]|nr:hypothetical protein [Allomuricauda sp.]
SAIKQDNILNQNILISGYKTTKILTTSLNLTQFIQGFRIKPLLFKVPTMAPHTFDHQSFIRPSYLVRDGIKHIVVRRPSLLATDGTLTNSIVFSTRLKVEPLSSIEP